MASNYKGNHFNKSLAIRICLNAELLKKAGFCANIITGLNRDNYLSLDTRFDSRVRGGDGSVSEAFCKFPLALLLHVSDLEATYIDEKRGV